MFAFDPLRTWLLCAGLTPDFDLKWTCSPKPFSFNSQASDYRLY